MIETSHQPHLNEYDIGKMFTDDVCYCKHDVISPITT